MSTSNQTASAPLQLDDLGVNLPAPADFSIALAEGFARRIVPFRGRAARRECGARCPSDGFRRRPAASRQDTDAPGEAFR